MNFAVGGHGLLLVMTEVIAAAKAAKDLPVEVQKALYHALPATPKTVPRNSAPSRG